MIKKLDTFIYFSMLLPFVQPLLNIGTDVSLIFIVLILIRLSITFKKINLTNLNVILTFYSIFLFIILISNSLSFQKALIPLLVSFLIIFLSNSYVDRKILKISVYIYLIFGLLWFLDSEIATKVQSVLVRNINTEGLIGVRGFPILSTEPGLFAGLIVMIAELFRIVFNSYRYKMFFIFILLLLSISSISGSSLVFIIIYLYYTQFKNNKKYLFIIITILLILGTSLLDYENRVTKFLSIFYNLDFSLLFADTSLSYRLSALLLGFLALILNPFPILSENIAKNSLFYFNEYLSNIFINNVEVHRVSSLGSYLEYGGVFSLIWFILLFLNLPSLKKSIYLIITLSFSYSLLFPLGYLLLYAKTNFISSNNNIK